MTGAVPASTQGLTLAHLTKTYGNVTALADVSLAIRPGHICAVLGENGAGKSTLLKILAGLIPAGAYEGDVRVDGQLVIARSPRDALLAGIGVIPKRRAIFPSMTVADNVAVSHWQSGGTLVVHRDRMRKEAQDALDLLEIHPDLDARADSLSPPQQRMLVIARALASHPKIVVLDEPAATLTTPQELGQLFRVVRLMAERNIAVLYMTRRVQEAVQIGDSTTVLRDGQVAGMWSRGGLDEAVVLRAMQSQRIGDGPYIDHDEGDEPRTLLDTLRSWFTFRPRD